MFYVVTIPVFDYREAVCISYIYEGEFNSGSVYQIHKQTQPFILSALFICILLLHLETYFLEKDLI